MDKIDNDMAEVITSAICDVEKQSAEEKAEKGKRIMAVYNTHSRAINAIMALPQLEGSDVKIDVEETSEYNPFCGELDMVKLITNIPSGKNFLGNEWIDEKFPSGHLKIVFSNLGGHSQVFNRFSDKDITDIKDLIGYFEEGAQEKLVEFVTKKAAQCRLLKLDI